MNSIEEALDIITIFGTTAIVVGGVQIILFKLFIILVERTEFKR